MAEQNAGRSAVKRHGAVDFVKFVAKDYKWEGLFHLETKSDDDKDWFVWTKVGDTRITDWWTEFPSQEFQTTLLLLGRVKNG